MLKKFIIIFLLVIESIFLDKVRAECVITTGMSYYNIKFETNEGNELENMNLCATCSDFMNTGLPTPTRTGYRFLGWYADEDLTIAINSIAEDWNKTTIQVEYDSENCLTNKMNVTLYARWEKDDCPIRDGGSSTIFQFETNDGEKINNISICNTCADALNAWENTTLPNPVKDGYTFDGWYTDKDLTSKIESIKDEKIIFEQKYDENDCSDGSRYTTLYAKWSKIAEKK